MSFSTSSLGTVLVVGGCGFVGHHVVRALLADRSSCTSIHVLSRSPNQNQFADASYHACDIASFASVSTLFSTIKPTTVIHTASPTVYNAGKDPALFTKVNVQGTNNLLACSKESLSVQAFVYCSSAFVVQGRTYSFANESRSLLSGSGRKDPYRQTKALADALVLAANDANHANGTSFKTCSLRPSSIFGEGDVQTFPGILAALANRETRYQIGDNTNHFDFVYVENVADAHITAARALLSNAPGVAGEAFFITNDAPMPFWTFVRKVWAVAGHDSSNERIIAIPLWMALAGAIIAEWVYWAATLGKGTFKRPLREVVEYSGLTKTFDIKKAKERLGYIPKVGIDEGIRRGVEWTMRNKETGTSAGMKKQR
ncbi:erg26, C-3 sterol dehydrogenase [Xylographa soralifera]|nr:erg26, C-3 sterol dehydrogenase [Xylographa soralifera]